MRITVMIICYDCQHKNYTLAGTPGYVEFEQWEFCTFSEAHQHMMKHPDHNMDFRIEGKDE